MTKYKYQEGEKLIEIDFESMTLTRSYYTVTYIHSIKRLPSGDWQAKPNINEFSLSWINLLPELAPMCEQWYREWLMERIFEVTSVNT